MSCFYWETHGGRYYRLCIKIICWFILWFLGFNFFSVLKFKDVKKKRMQRIPLTTVLCRVIWSKNQQFSLHFKPVNTYQSPCAYIWTEPTYFEMSCKIKWSTGHFSLEVTFSSHSPFISCISASAPPLFFLLFLQCTHAFGIRLSNFTAGL